MKLAMFIARVMDVCGGSAARRYVQGDASTTGKIKFRNLIWGAALTLFATVPALASTNWFVDGVKGNDNNNCQPRQHACKTISNAIFLSLPGDSTFIAPAIYHESLIIPFTLKIYGSGAKTTIVDAGGISNQVAVVGSRVRGGTPRTARDFRVVANQESSICSPRSICIENCLPEQSQCTSANAGLHAVHDLGLIRKPHKTHSSLDPKPIPADAAAAAKSLR